MYCLNVLTEQGHYRRKAVSKKKVGGLTKPGRWLHG